MVKKLSNFNRLETILNYKFKNKNLLEEALTHSSKKIKNNLKIKFNYERLEFLGDRILGFIIAEKVFCEYPNLSEGTMNSIYQKYTNEKFLCKVAIKLNLDSFVRTQHGDDLESNKSILSDVIESLIAAIYLDSNLTSCKNFIFKKILENKSLTMQTNKHPKSYLQEITLKYFKFMPTYELIKKTGPDHNPNFLVKVKINDKLYSQSEGKNIQIAEQNAAKKLIPIVKKNINYDKNKI